LSAVAKSTNLLYIFVVVNQGATWLAYISVRVLRGQTY